MPSWSMSEKSGAFIKSPFILVRKGELKIICNPLIIARATTLRYSTYMELDQTLIDAVTHYIPSHERLMHLKDVPLLFLVGISGAGKNAIMTVLLSDYANQYHEFVTHTTRAPRKNHGTLERNGVEYYFIDYKTSRQMLADHDYIEANIYSNNIYGTSVAEIEAAKHEGRIAIGDIDVNGVEHVVGLGLNVQPVFILPPSYQTWQQRLLKRYEGHDIDQTDWRNRMVTARSEIEHALATDYFYFVVNEDLATTVAEINEIAHGKEYDHRAEIAIAAAKDILNGINDALIV
jgi:guanylate kinase